MVTILRKGADESQDYKNRSLHRKKRKIEVIAEKVAGFAYRARSISQTGRAWSSKERIMRNEPTLIAVRVVNSLAL